MFDSICKSGRWLHSFLHARTRLLACLALPFFGIAISLVVHSQTAPPAIPTVALADDPMSSNGTREKPTMALALSVETPTVGAQYFNESSPNSTFDPTYTTAKEYICYYD